MRITDIQIDGFGKFHDHSIRELGPGLTVFHGMNEAGKTTLLTFIRRVLFGFPKKNARCNLYDPFQGGRAGGRLGVMAHGHAYTLERIAGKGFTIHLPDGSTGTDLVIKNILDKADKDIFENVYAFGLDELQDLDRLGSEAISGKLYSAGTGLGRITIPEIKIGLDKKQRELFLPTGKKPQINELFLNIQEKEKQLRELKNEQDEYDILNIELDKNTKQIENVKSKRQELLIELSFAEDLLDVREDWELQRDANLELTELPDMDSFPENGLAELDNLNERIREAEQKTEKTEEELEKIHIDQRNVMSDERLLEKSQNIKQLYKGIEKYRAEKETGYENELKDQNEELDRMLRNIGPDWNREKLSAFDSSIPAKEEVYKRHEILESLDQQIKELERDLKNANAELKNESIEPVNELLLSKKNEILRLSDLIGDYQTRLLAAGKLDTENRALANKLKFITEELPGCQDPSVTDHFDLSAGNRKHATDMESSFEDLKREENDLRPQITWNEEHMQELEQSMQELEARINNLHLVDPDELARKLTSIQDLRSLIMNLREKEIELNAFRKEERLYSMIGSDHSSPKWPAGAFIVMGVAGVATGYAIEQLFYGVLFCIIMLAVAALYMLSVSGKKEDINSDIQTSSGQLSDEIRTLRDRGGSLSRICGFDSIPDPSSLERYYESLKENSLQLQHAAQLNEQKEAILKKKEKINVKIQSLADQMKELSCLKEQLGSQWSSWLAKNGLDVDICPEDIEHVFTRITECQELLDRTRDMEASIAENKASIEAFEHDIEELVGQLEIEGNYSGGHVEKLKRIRDELDLEVQKNIQHDLADEKREELEHRLEQLEMELTDKRTQRSTEFERWEQWLAKYGHSSQLTTRAIIEVFSTIDSCLKVQDRIRDLEHKMDRSKEYITDHESQISDILDACDRKKDGLAFDTLLEKLNEDLEYSIKEKDRASVLQNEEDKLKVELGNAQQRSAQLQERKQDLLIRGHAESEAVFGENAAIWKRRCELNEQINQACRNIKRTPSARDNSDRFLNTMEEYDRHQLENRHDRLTEMMQTADEQLEQLSSAKGKLINQIDHLENEHGASKLRLEIGCLKQKANLAAREWSRIAIAQHILDKAVEKYEHQRQPAVITTAQDFFTKITGGTYKRIYSPLGSSDIFAEDEMGRKRPTSQLSTGTAQQLYLALRFGFIKELGKHAEPMPLIFDDILVNFDPIRSRNTVETIKELARDEQIMFFTCHPSTVDMFKELIPDVGIVQLED